MVIAPPTKMESRGTDEPPPAEEDENSAWEPPEAPKGAWPHGQMVAGASWQGHQG